MSMPENPSRLVGIRDDDVVLRNVPMQDIRLEQRLVRFDGIA
jgi:hypothetical protein